MMGPIDRPYSGGWLNRQPVREKSRLPQVFHPSDDELNQRLSTVELVVDGEKLHDLKMTVSESILDSAKVQAQGKILI